MSPALWYLLLIAIALGALKLHPIDHDPGPLPGQRYPRWDRWSSWHLVGSMLLAALAIVVLGVSPLWSFVLTVVAGLGWEVVNGYIDPVDVGWDALGALVGVFLVVVLS